MDAEPPLDYLLDGPTGPTPGREELLAIVARSHARRNRLAALGMAVTLTVGAVGGWLAGVGSGKSSGGATLAAGQPSTNAPVPSLGRPLIANTTAHLIKQFVRTTSDGVTIRAYQSPVPQGVITFPTCGTGGTDSEVVPPSLQVEVSTAAVAAQTYSSYGPAEGPFSSFSESTIGAAEGAPVWVVTVGVEASVVQVKVTFSDGTTDQMAPIGGWAVLAHVAPAGKTGTTTYGNIEARDASGKLIAGVTFPTLPAIIGSPSTVVFPQSNAPMTTVPAASAVPATAGAVAGAPNASAPAPTGTGATVAPPPTLLPGTVPAQPCTTC